MAVPSHRSGFLETNAQGRVLAASDAFCEIVGLEADDLVGGVAPYEWWPSDQVPWFEAQLGKDLASAPSRGYFEGQFAKPDGTRVQVFGSVAGVRDETGTCQRFVWSVAEADKEPNALASPSDSTQEDIDGALQRLFDSNIVGIITGVGDRVLNANDYFLGMLGYDHSDLVSGGIDWVSLTPPEFLEVDAKAGEEMAKVGRSGPIYKEYVHRDGHRVPVRIAGATISAQPFRWVSYVDDISELKEAERRLRDQAATDALTGAANRGELERLLDHALEDSLDSGTTGAVIFVDLNKFKALNDTHGHYVGDLVLREAVRRIQNAVRKEDTVCRIGGDEFLVICEKQDERGALAAAERIVDLLSRSFNIGGQVLRIGASCGIARFPADGADVSAVISNADRAMYASKRRGGGVTAHRRSESAVGVSGSYDSQVRALRKAISNDEFCLHYQPVVSLGSGKVTGFEALARWNHPYRGLLGPSEFLQVAEESGLIITIGNHLISQALRQAGVWATGSGLVTTPHLSINLSRRQFAATDLCARLKTAIAGSHVDPGTLVFEVTETALFDDQEQATEVMEEIRAMGCAIALDDFGTGYSSLAMLQDLPVDVLKIDREFVSRLDCDDPAVCDTPPMNLLANIVDMGRTLGMDVYAEGVETQQQHQCVRRAGVGHAQGFLYGRPMPGEAVLPVARQIDAARLT